MQLTIADNYRSICNRIAQAARRASRDPADVHMVAAVKGQPAQRVNEAIAAGLRIIGHNYLQEAADKLPKYDRIPELTFHFIGRVQTNKASPIAELFNVVETIDSMRAADALNRNALRLGKILRCLIQVNIAREPQKAGAHEETVGALADAIASLQGLDLRGLMIMPPFFDEPEKARPYFARLKQIADSLRAQSVLPDEFELSMGMSGDFEAAVEEGATMVRIGTALFGARPLTTCATP
jgi:pyridoxal phosphate enzyme (YggS family)